MSYLPRPDADRTGQDVDEIYALTADELRKATTPEQRRKAFRHGLLRAFEDGVDAQREIIHSYPHERPTPVPPPPVPQEGEQEELGDTDPGFLPQLPPPAGTFKKP